MNNNNNNNNGECNNDLRIISDSFRDLNCGFDIRGQFVPSSHDMDDARRQQQQQQQLPSLKHLAQAISQRSSRSPAPLMPFSAYCLGRSFARMILASSSSSSSSSSSTKNENVSTTTTTTTIAIGRDPRCHGEILAHSLSQGIAVEGVRVLDTELATTPAMYSFCRCDLCNGAIMITASHLPKDWNGLKLFTKDGGFMKKDVNELIEGAIVIAETIEKEKMIMHDDLLLDGLIEKVDFMPHYIKTIRNALISEVMNNKHHQSSTSDTTNLPLKNLRIVVNAGNGSGYILRNILHSLGADVTPHSIGCDPDGTFPNSSNNKVPNPESEDMVRQTMTVCRACQADLGVMLDTDADRAGFVLPRGVSTDDNSEMTIIYEPLHRNRLIALLGVIIARSSSSSSSRGTVTTDDDDYDIIIVTDNATSEGLTTFFETTLGFTHYRYIKGYANVIAKAKELNTMMDGKRVEMAIETSGHCAMRENDFMDDGMYAAVKIIGFLAQCRNNDRVGDDDDDDDCDDDIATDRRRRRRRQTRNYVWDAIKDMKEMAVTREIRMVVTTGASSNMISRVFDRMTDAVERAIATAAAAAASDDCPERQWKIDRENEEGVRVATGGGGFFLMRCSLHEPIVSLFAEGSSMDEVVSGVVGPLLRLFENDDYVAHSLELSLLKELVEGCV